MSEKIFFVDSTKCIGCGACQVSCKLWNELPSEKSGFFEGPEYSNPGTFSPITWSKVFYSMCEKQGNKYEWTILHQKCNHCYEPNCMDACPEKAIYKHNGWVLVNLEKCIGCKSCEESCVYSAIHVSKKNYNNLVKKDKAYKCHGCVLVNKQDIPPCASQCPTGALVYDYRLKTIKNAKKRLSEVKNNHPDAYIYGFNQFGGLNVLTLFKNKIDDPIYDVNAKSSMSVKKSGNQLYYLLSRCVPPIKKLRRKILNFTRSLNG